MLGQVIAQEPRILGRAQKRHALVEGAGRGLVALVDVIEDAELHRGLSLTRLSPRMAG